MHLLVAEALGAQVLDQDVPALGGVADAELLGRGLVEAALGQLFPADRRLGGGGRSCSA